MSVLVDVVVAIAVEAGYFVLAGVISVSEADVGAVAGAARAVGV